MKRTSLVLLVLPVLVPIVLQGCIRTAEDVQRDYAHHLMPTQLKGAPPPPPPANANVNGVNPAAPAETRSLRTMRIRIYADVDFQNQTRHWQERVQELFTRANGLVEPRFGVSFQIESFRDWDRPDRTRTMEEALAELIARDDGKDVDWVVGFVSSLPVFTASQDQLGIAPLFARHFVLRSMESIGEVAQLNEILSKLPVDEREALFRERRLHKETTVLLHEWAHTLGVFHDRTVDWMMSPTYNDRQASFAPETEPLIELGLRSRDAKELGGRAKWGQEFKALVAATTSHEWSPEARDQAVSNAESVLEGKMSATQGAMNNADGARFNQALDLLRAGKVEQAQTLLEPLIPGYPADLGVQELACELQHRRAPKAPETLVACRRAAVVSGGAPEAWLELGSVLLGTEDRPAAVDALEKARSRMLSGKANPRAWQNLAALYVDAHMPTRAEEAVDRCPPTAETEKIEAAALKMRHWSGLPPQATFVKPEREYEYIDAMYAASEDVDAQRMDRAHHRRDGIAKTYAGAPGPAMIDCAIEARSAKAIVRVRAACEPAVKAFPDAIYAQYLLGLTAESEHKRAEAVQHFERAVSLDPEYEPAWSRLIATYAATHDTKASTATAERYRSVFGHDPERAPGH